MPRKRARKTRSPVGDAHQAGPGTVVSLDYELLDAEGECVDRSPPDSWIEILLGFGVAPDSLERGLSGLSPGATRDVVLAPHEGFGERDPEALIEVDRAELPSDVAEGDQLDADREDGSGPVFLKVLEVREDAVVLDTNHPLAGQKVRLRVHIQDVRPATTEEMDAAAAALAAAEAQEESGPDVPSHGPLLPVERLLKRGRDKAAGPEGGSEPDPTPPHKRAVIV